MVLAANFGAGSATCTLTGGNLQVQNKKLGPDGDNWVVLSDQDVTDLCNANINFRHVSGNPIAHLCAQKGTWAFTVFTSSLPKTVAFLHIRSPAKLDAAMGDGSVENVFSGAKLLTGYQLAEQGARAPRVWRRNVVGWDEIAINFCLRL